MFNRPFGTSFGGSTGFRTTSLSGQNFGASTSTNTVSGPFGSMTGSLFGPTGFPAAPTGTTIKFQPPTNVDTLAISGVSARITARHQCITAMKEYEKKSLEELRLEDYQANRKGPGRAGIAVSLFGPSVTRPATGLFGSSTTSQGFPYGQSNPSFGTSATNFGSAAAGALFHQQSQPTTLLNKPFSQARTTQSTAFSFGSTPLGQANTNTTGLFGASQAAQPGGPFGAPSSTSAATGFGAGSRLLGQSFGAGTSTLFVNKPAGFGTTTTSAPSFGTTTSSSKVLAAPGAGQKSLFGSTQTTLGVTQGTGGFGTPGSSTAIAPLGFGAPQPAVDPNASAAQQALLQQYLFSLMHSPFGDSPLFRNPLPGPTKEEERLAATNPAAQKALKTHSPYKLSPRPEPRVRPNVLQSAGYAKSLCGGLEEDDEPVLHGGAFMPRKSIKRLVLKNLKSIRLFSPGNHEKEDVASPLECPEKRDGQDNEQEEEEEEDHHQVIQLYTNPIVKPTPQTPESTVQDSLVSLSTGLEGCSEEASFPDAPLQEECKEQPEPGHHHHPAGITLTRNGYYTIPSLEDLAGLTNDSSECVVTNFTIGRRGYGSIYFEGEVNLTNLNLDEIVHIRRNEVIIYPDDGRKPPVGEGLNRRAEVTLDGVWPTDKTSRCLIQSPQQLEAMNYAGRLEALCRRQGAQFVEYRPETGSWVFKVAHFSQHGLQESDEEEQAQGRHPGVDGTE
ncbi:nuclear pore complex protein Nup98-Nup96-like [Melanerpes formicivorus]|uniref:nuclear pore complex protein Nup98-Nup96-like n=1 Tax=Melanerpes formicivorus TaxID=211600 RepID=UPI00358E57A9